MLKIVFTSEDNENSMFGIEEFPISTELTNQINQKAVNPTAFSCM